MSEFGWLTARPIAHRGYHDRAAGRIENTLPAAEAAIARNFAIECDLQLTADGRVVVFHDDTLDRLGEAEGPVGARTLADLRAIRLRDTDARIPTLEDLLDLVDGQVPLVIELKSQWNGDRRLEQAVAPILDGYSGPAAVMSFDPMSMVAMRRLLAQPAARHDRRRLPPRCRRRRPPLAAAFRPPPSPWRGGGLAAFRLLRHRRAAGERTAAHAPYRRPAHLLDDPHAGRPAEGAGLHRPDHLRGLRPGRAGGLTVRDLHRSRLPLNSSRAAACNRSTRP